MSAAQVHSHDASLLVAPLVEAVLTEEMGVPNRTVYVDPRPIHVRHAADFPGGRDYEDVDEEWVAALAAAVQTAGTDTRTTFP